MAKKGSSNASASMAITQKAADGSLSKQDVGQLRKSGVKLGEILKVAGNDGLLFNEEAVDKYGISQVRTGQGRAADFTRSVKSGGLGYRTFDTYAYRAGMEPGAAGQGSAQKKQAASAPVDQWSQSVDAGTQSIINSLNATIQANQKNQELYMGMFSNLMDQMNVGQQAAAMASPYAVTTGPVQGAPTAQTTQVVGRRPRMRNTSLAIGGVAPAAGASLNIAT